MLKWPLVRMVCPANCQEVKYACKAVKQRQASSTAAELEICTERWYRGLGLHHITGLRACSLFCQHHEPLRQSMRPTACGQMFGPKWKVCQQDSGFEYRLRTDRTANIRRSMDICRPIWRHHFVRFSVGIPADKTTRAVMTSLGTWRPTVASFVRPQVRLRVSTDKPL